MSIWKSKFKAFSTHFAISLVIFVVLAYLIIFHWYPPPFFATDGGWQGIRIIAVVDLVLGPTLTFLVFKPGKKGLKFDLTVIGLVQLVALSWGMYTVYTERPVAVVFVEDNFNPVTSYQLEEVGYDPKQLPSLEQAPPIPVYSDLPVNDINKMQSIRARALQKQLPLFLETKFYAPMNEENIAKVYKGALDLPLLIEVRPELKPIYKDFIGQNKSENYAFFALHARHKRQIIVIDKNTFEFVASLPTHPPKMKELYEMDKLKRKRANVNNAGNEK